MTRPIRFVYVAGPITSSGGEGYVPNIRAGILVGERLRTAGLIPFIPHQSLVWELIAPLSYEDIMTVDFAWLSRCDALLRLPGFSRGADREVQEALHLGLPIFYTETSLLAAAQAQLPLPLV